MTVKSNEKVSRIRARVWRAFNPVFWLEFGYSAFIKLRLRKCGGRLRLTLNTVIKGHKNIVLGDNFSSMGVLYLYASDGGYLQIGRNCSVNTNVQFGASQGSIIVGDNVLIAPNVVIRAANHGMSRDEIMRDQPHSCGKIIIEDDVWIGSNAVITAGVTLARGTIVGACSVVTKSTESYSIVGGVPAKRIGERV